jgi:hypothetical protein
MALGIISDPAYAFKNEPDGFRGIQWGADLSAIKGMKHIGSLPQHGGVKIYAREDDALQIGKATLESIEYASWQGKFLGVFIKTFFFSDWEALKAACFENFGRGDKPKVYNDEYFWKGDKATINLVVNEGGIGGTLYILSTELTLQQEAYGKSKKGEKQKTTDVPKSGF